MNWLNARMHSVVFDFHDFREFLDNQEFRVGMGNSKIYLEHDGEDIFLDIVGDAIGNGWMVKFPETADKGSKRVVGEYLLDRRNKVLTD